MPLPPGLNEAELLIFQLRPADVDTSGTLLRPCVATVTGDGKTRFGDRS